MRAVWRIWHEPGSPVYVKSLSAHAVRALIIARKKLVGHRVTLENQIRGLPSHAGLPSSCTPCFETARSSKPRKGASNEAETSSRAEHCQGREWAMAPIL